MQADLIDKSTALAYIEGREVTQLPEDLFIPPDALEVLLDSFSGPLDFLLYLIKKQNIDILNIPIISITRQYLMYIDIMEANRKELAPEYLLMTAMLAEIKSRMLLPVSPSEDEEDEGDPRMMLVKRLIAYEQMKDAAEMIDGLMRQDRDHFLIGLQPDSFEAIHLFPELDFSELMRAFGELLLRDDQSSDHQIRREAYSVRERMADILLKLEGENFMEFRQFFLISEGRAGLVVTLLAILELARESLLTIVQAHPFAPIHLRANHHE